MMQAVTQMPFLIGMPWLYALLGALAGGCAAYIYRLLPARWLCDYGEMPQPSHAADCRKLSAPAVLAMALLCAGCTAGLADLALPSGVSGASSMSGASGIPMAALLLCAALAACLVAVLLLAALCDARYAILPDQLLLAAGALALGLWAAGGLRGLHTAWYSPFLGAAAGFLGLWAVLIVAGKLYKTEAMGFGDVKLLAALGALCGPRALGVAALLAVFSGGAVMGALLLCKKITRRSRVPFGPFLVGGALASACLWQQWCAFGAWYLSLFGL